MAKRVALVLGSGGARGYAHIGVIAALEARGYEIACIAGCSMGAVVGGIYAAGKLGQYRAWIESLDYLDVLKLLDVSFSLGAIRGEKIFGKIHQLLGDIAIEDLPIPFTAVATDLTNHQEIWFQEGCLHRAMRASAAIPTLFTPVVQGNRVLVDGGLLNPLPIVPVVSAHCDLIVAVNLNAANQLQYQLPVIERAPVFKGKLEQLLNNLGAKLTLKQPSMATSAAVGIEPQELDKRLGRSDGPPSQSASSAHALTSTGPASLLELVNQSFEAMQSSLSQYKIAGYPPDILINFPKRVCRFFEFYKAQELILLGEQIAHDTLARYEHDHA